MATKDLGDLAYLLFEDLYGRTGADVLDVMITRGRSTVMEISRRTRLPPSAVTRTLATLVHQRFALWWQGPRHTTYSANWRQIYALLWSGQLLAMFPNEAEILGKLLVEGCLRPDDAVKRLGVERAVLDDLVSRHKLLKNVRTYEYWPESELLEDLASRHSRALSSDPRQMGLSETAKKASIIQSVESDLRRLRDDVSTTEPEALALNWDRFLIVARRQELVAFAQRKIGEVSARVYEQVLISSEDTLRNVREARVPSPDTTVSTASIAGILARTEVDLAAPFFELPKDDGQDTPPTKKSKMNSGASKPVLDTRTLVGMHLEVLQQAGFVQRSGDSEWFVQFDEVVAQLRQDKLDTIAAVSFGAPAARMLRMIRAAGKTDEKLLGARVLLPTNEIRHHMSALHFYGFVDIQEIPRPSERNGQKRSYYLWYHRSEWAYMRVTQILYRQLAQTLRDIRALRSEHETLLKKMGREDVQNEQEAYLTAKEKQELQDFTRAEQELLAKQNLWDRHIRIFRDY